MPFFAHSHSDIPHDQWQSLSDHLTETAQTAGDFASAFDSREWGYLCGLLHDLGKYSAAFQRRLAGGKQRVDHSLAGALEVIRHLEASSLAPLANLLAHIISGHHTGLADGIAENTDAPSLKERLRTAARLPDYSAWKKELALPQNVLQLPAFSRQKRAGDQAFTFFFWTRMLYSCLVDADFLDTESFLAPDKSALRGGYPSVTELHTAFNDFMQEKAVGGKSGTVNDHRARVLVACRNAALWEQGLFSLTVPTGGGKTLSSLAFALEHAAKHSLRRIIYVIPYTSIIEQTADVFRGAFGSELAHAVIEHHSNAEERPGTSPKAADHYEDARTLAFENWDAPIIVTTAVQFFESLFAARSSRCRKLHRIAESVVILDEAQTLPTPLFRPCLAALKELTGIYRTSVMLCTATQPEVGEKPWNRNGLENVREIVPDPPALFQALDRVTVEFIGTLEAAELAAQLNTHERALCIVNTRAQAREACELVRAAAPESKAVFHLSTWMCPAHRKAVLRRIRELLADPAKPPLLLVATSLIEAGVDIDFPVVYRALTGVDSIAQAAGRCNREGRLKRGYTFVFSLPGTLNGEQDRRRNATEAVLRANLPLLSPAATAVYFDELHSLVGSEGLDQPKILQRVAEQVHAKRADWGLFPFRSVARDFRFIDSDELPLIIPYNEEARAALARLRDHKADRALYRRLQQWIVGLKPREMGALLKTGAQTVGFADQYYELTNEDLYRGLEGKEPTGPAVGLDIRNPVFRDVKGLMF